MPECCQGKKKKEVQRVPCEPSTSRSELPECLNKRYKILDKIITELNSATKAADDSKEGSNVGVKLMCDFWDILQNDPECNLTQEVQKRMGVEVRNSGGNIKRRGRNVAYVVENAGSKGKGSGCCGGKPPAQQKAAQPFESKPLICGGDDLLPLSKVLCSIEEAASVDKKCNARINALMQTQKQLQDQITHLEHREKEGTQMLKQADQMWSTMEAQYKKKLQESQKRQTLLLKELKNLENNVKKWRTNQRDLEFQMHNIKKCKEEINEKTNQKLNDIKVMDMEIEELAKRIEISKGEIYNSQNNLHCKKNASDARVKNIETEINRVKNAVAEEIQHKKIKEDEGAHAVQEARLDLQNVCKVLIEKKLENEDLVAEKNALIEELDTLKKTYDSCTARCKKKDDSLDEEIKKLTKEIADCHGKCIQCHVKTDTDDVRNFCTDCPRCLKEKQCAFESDHCCADHTQDCICMSVKEKFLDNVFDNMYTVLERKIKTNAGKALADALANSLTKSKNGKIDAPTRKILQEFILTVVKKNLDLTIVGGAVKTRCEMDKETYDQLMLCLKDVQVKNPAKDDKNMPSRKDPCRRWGGPHECNCPKGPKDCVCTKKAPPPPHDPKPCPNEDTSNVKMCPYKKEKKPCGPDCGMQSAPIGLGPEVESWRPAPCEGPTCPFSKNMRAAQCVLGPDKIKSDVSTKADFDIYGSCANCGLPMEQCPCFDDVKDEPRLRVIKEVMGRCKEASPIEKVDKEDTKGVENSDLPREMDEYCDCAIVNEFKITDIFDNKYECSRVAPKKKLRKKKQRHCAYTKLLKVRQDHNETYVGMDETIFSDLVLNSKAIITDNKINAIDRSIQTTGKKQPADPQLKAAFKEKLIQGPFKNPIKIIFKDNSGIFSRQVTRLEETKSGHLVMDLQGRIIRLLERKPISYMTVSLNKSSSGHLMLDFDCKNNIVSDNCKVFVRKIASEVFLDLHKNIVNRLRDTMKTKENYSKLSTKSESQYPCKLQSKLDFTTYSRAKSDCGSSKTGLEVVKSKSSPKRELILIRKVKCPDLNTKSSTTKSNRFFAKNQSPCLSSNGRKNYVLRECKKILEANEQMEEGYNDNNKLVRCCHDSTTNTFSTILYYKNNITEGKAISPPGLESFRQESFNSSDKPKLYFKVIGKNGVESRFESEVTKTESGTSAADVTKILSLGELMFHDDEHPVSLSKDISGTYTISIGEGGQDFNATIRRITDNKLVLLKKYPVIKKDKKLKTDSYKKIFNVKIFGIKKHPIEVPAVLRCTSSNNYVIVLDKEFEKRYKESIESFLGENYECYVALRRDFYNHTISININDSNLDEAKTSLLVKTSSGTIKVLMDGPEFDAISENLSKRSSSVSTKEIETLLTKLTVADHVVSQEMKISPNFTPKKSSSDSQLYETVKLQNHNNSLLEPSATLAKTASDNFAIVLNKELKKSFINNLNTYLANNPKRFVPIKKTPAGETVIMLNNSDKCKGNFGSVKITNSGSLYVVVDERVIKEMVNDPKRNDILTKEISIKNDAMSGCSCITSKKDFNRNCRYVFLHNTPDSVHETILSDYKPQYCSKEKSSDIVKPSAECETVVQQIFASAEYYYSQADSISPTLGSYESVSNDLQRIPSTTYEYNNTEIDQAQHIEFDANAQFDGDKEILWGSLNSLPPQLPPFLRNGFIINDDY